MAKKPANQAPPRSFEEALAELEQILGEIENGEVGLEESLVKYERGNFLIQHCRGVLSQAEQQIELLSKAADGELKSEPLVPDGDSAAANDAGMIDEAPPPPPPPPSSSSQPPRRS